jgi:hypothetical protein
MEANEKASLLRSNLCVVSYGRTLDQNKHQEREMNEKDRRYSRRAIKDSDRGYSERVIQDGGWWLRRAGAGWPC